METTQALFDKIEKQIDEYCDLLKQDKVLQKKIKMNSKNK